MTIALAQDVEDFLKDQVRAGVSSNASELVNQVFRALREQQVKPFALTPALETWLLEAADQPVSPLTAGDFTGIRDRVRSRVKTSAS